MTSQGLQIASPEDSLTRLRIVTNGIVIVNIVLRVQIFGCRRLPVLIQRFTYLFFLHGLLQYDFDSMVIYFVEWIRGCVFTTTLSLCLAWIRLSGDSGLQRLAHLTPVPISFRTIELSKADFQRVRGSTYRRGCIGKQDVKAEYGHMAASVVDRHSFSPNGSISHPAKGPDMGTRSGTASGRESPAWFKTVYTAETYPTW